MSTTAENSAHLEPTTLSSENPNSPSLAPNGTDHHATEEKYERPLSIVEGTKLKDRYIGSDYNSLPMGTDVHRMEERIKRTLNTAMVFQNGTGDTITSQQNSRFSNKYAKRMYKRITGFDRTLISEYSNPHTGHITLTGNPFNEEGGWRAPVDYLNDLTESWSNLTDAIRYSLSDKEYEYVAVLGPTEHGYAHIHLCVWVDGPVAQTDLEPAVDAHVRNSPVADAEYHQYEDCLSVERASDLKRSAETDNPATAMASYAANHLLTLDSELEELSRSDKFFAVTLDASGTRQVRGSQRFSQETGRCQQSDSNDGDGWEFVGMEVDGETYDVEDTSGGGSNFTEIRGLPEAVDPVS